MIVKRKIDNCEYNFSAIINLFIQFFSILNFSSYFACQLVFKF